jgi:hypothetical protein
MPQFEYLGMTVRNPKLIQEEMKRRLIADNFLYNSVQNLSIFLSAV